MKVLYLSMGHTTHDYRFLASLVSSGYEMAHMPWRPSSVPEDSRPWPTAVRRYEPRGSREGLPGRLTRLRRAVQEFAPDLVHAGPVPGPAFWAATQGLSPLVSMSWGSDLLWHARRGLKKWKARFALRRSSAFLGDCEAVRQAGLGLGMPADRIVIFPWGVDLQKFSPGSDLKWRVDRGWGDKFVILCTRSWERLYGVDLLLESFLNARDREPSLRLLLVGSGSLEADLRRRIEGAGAAGWVHLAGRVAYDDLPAWYRSADLFVSPARTDGTSVSLLEAMACGMAIVVSDIATNREWIRQGENGWWFRDGDRASLEVALLSARHSGDRTEMGRRARAVAEDRADWSRNQRLLIGAYEMARASRQAVA